MKILTPTNFSICAASALDYTAFLAEKLHAAILLVHVLPAVRTPERAVFASNKKAAASLEAAAAYWRSKGYRIETLLLNGHRASQIAGAAADWGCRLIVMGLSSRRRIKDYMVGSLAERVIRLSQIPVLVVKEHKRKVKAQPERAWKNQIKGGIGDAVLGQIDIHQLKY